MRSASASDWRLLLALGGVDAVHGLLHVGGQIDGRDERAHHVVTVGHHEAGYRLVHIRGDGVLLVEHLIEGVLRHAGAQGVDEVGAHLGRGIGQHVVAAPHARGLSLGRRLGAHAGDWRGDGHVTVTLCAGLRVDAELLLAGTHVHLGGDGLEERDLEVQARSHRAVELAQPLNDVDVLLRNDEQRLGQEQHQENDDDSKSDHGIPFVERARRWIGNAPA